MLFHRLVLKIDVTQPQRTFYFRFCSVLLPFFHRKTCYTVIVSDLEMSQVATTSFNPFPNTEPSRCEAAFLLGENRGAL